jgi:hypothetical protein
MVDRSRPQDDHEIRDVEGLVREFEACTLPRERWTHRAHLTVGLWYLSRYPEGEAIDRIRSGIQRFNEAKGVKQTRDGGYHETITRFYIWVITRFLAESGPGRPLAELADELFARCGDRSLPLRYWSKDLLMSWDARAGWIDPDLRELSFP